MDDETVIESPKACRWLDSGKYFRWSGDMLINDHGSLLTLEMSLHQEGHTYSNQNIVTKIIVFNEFQLKLLKQTTLMIIIQLKNC